MKNLLLTFVLFFITTLNIHGQTIENLDIKRGFKDFTLGDALSKWGTELEYKSRIDENTFSFTYVGDCCAKVFEYDVDDITLRFSNKVLVGIDIKTKKIQKEYTVSGKYTKFTTDHLDNVKSSLSYLFGEPSLYNVQESDATFYYSWIGKEVILILTYQYLGVSGGDLLIINVIDLEYFNKDIENGF